MGEGKQAEGVSQPQNRRSWARFLDREQLQTVTLLSVEEAGIWITSKEVVAGLVEKFKVAPSSPDLALFLPYGQIEAILAAFDAAA